MIKKIISTYLLIGFSIAAVGQKEIELEFENGEKKTFSMNYDNPYYTPKFRFEISPFGMLSGIADGGDFNFPITGGIIFRHNRDWSFLGAFQFPYTRKSDYNLRNNLEKGNKRVQDYKLSAYYTLSDKIKTKTRFLAVDFDDSSSVAVTYKAKLPRNELRKVQLEMGLGNFTYFANMYYFENLKPNQSKDTRYYFGNLSTWTANFGINRIRSESYEMKTDEKVRAYWRMTTVYANINIGLLARTEYFETIAIPKYPGARTYDYIDQPLSNESKKPKFNRIGFRTGFRKNMGTKGTSNSLFYGVEAGLMPRLVAPDRSSTFPGIFKFFLGISIGSHKSDLK